MDQCCRQLIEQQRHKSILFTIREQAESLFSHLTQDQKDFYTEHISIDADGAINICKDSFDNRGVWLSVRSKKVTGYVCYPLYTYSTNKNPDWNKKIIQIYNSDFKGNASTRYGIENEPLARLKYAENTNSCVQQVGFVSCPIVPPFGFSPDGVVMVDRKPIKLLEIKCPITGKIKTAEAVFKESEMYDKKNLCMKKKHRYYGQMQLGMALCGVDICDLVIYAPFDKTVYVETVQFDEQFATKMMSALCDVYFMHLLPFFMK